MYATRQPAIRTSGARWDTCIICHVYTLTLQKDWLLEKEETFLLSSKVKMVHMGSTGRKLWKLMMMWAPIVVLGYLYATHHPTDNTSAALSMCCDANSVVAIRAQFGGCGSPVPQSPTPPPPPPASSSGACLRLFSLTTFSPLEAPSPSPSALSHRHHRHPYHDLR